MKKFERTLRVHSIHEANGEGYSLQRVKFRANGYPNDDEVGFVIGLDACPRVGQYVKITVEFED